MLQNMTIVKDLISRIDAEMVVFKKESDFLIEKEVKSARARKSTLKFEKLLK
jgi:hypothetical protein